MAIKFLILSYHTTFMCASLPPWKHSKQRSACKREEIGIMYPQEIKEAIS